MLRNQTRRGSIVFLRRLPRMHCGDSGFFNFTQTISQTERAPRNLLESINTSKSVGKEIISFSKSFALV